MARVCPCDSFQSHTFAVKVDSLGGESVSDVQEEVCLLEDDTCRQVKSCPLGTSKPGRTRIGGSAKEDLGRYLRTIDAKLASLSTQVSHVNASMDNFSQQLDSFFRKTSQAQVFANSGSVGQTNAIKQCLGGGTDTRDRSATSSIRELMGHPNVPKQDPAGGLRAAGRDPQPLAFVSVAETVEDLPAVGELGVAVQDSVRTYRRCTICSKDTATFSNTSQSARFGLFDVLRDGLRYESRRRSSSSGSRRSSAATSCTQTPATPAEPPPAPPCPHVPASVLNGFMRPQLVSETQHEAPQTMELPDAYGNDGDASTTILHILAQAESRNVAVQKVWEVIDDPLSSGAATFFALCNQYFVLFTVFLVFMETIPNSPLGGTTAAVLQITIDFIFVCEAFLRFSVYPNRQAYFYNIHNVIDMLMVVPLFMRISISFILPDHAGKNFGNDVLWCTVPLLRLLKVARHFESFRFLVKAFAISTEALPMLFYAMLLEVTLFSALIYWAEPRDNIHSLPHAVWLTLVTMTTVTYGDVVPKTTCGTVTVAALMICSLMLLGVPVGIMGNTFIEVWKNRDRDLLISRTRAALQKWGYTASDIPLLFKVVDGNANGEIDLSEFCDLVHTMKLGMPQDRIIELFNQLDKDSNNSIDAMEFGAALWPEAYIEASSRGPSLRKEEASYIRRISKHFSADTRNFALDRKSMDSLPSCY